MSQTSPQFATDTPLFAAAVFVHAVACRDFHTLADLLGDGLDAGDTVDSLEVNVAEFLAAARANRLAVFDAVELVTVDVERILFAASIDDNRDAAWAIDVRLTDDGGWRIIRFDGSPPVADEGL